MKAIILYLFLPIILIGIWSCRKDPDIPVSKTTPYTPELPALIGTYIGPMDIPDDNSLTVEGIALGKKLFYDERLSNTESVNCNSCHKQEFAFSIPSNALANINGGTIRNIMPLFNLGWVSEFPWDGRKSTLELKIEESIQNPFTLDGKPEIILPRLQADPIYPSEFEVIFGDNEITMERIAKALAQFFRTLISGDSPFDKYLTTGPGTTGWSAADELKAYQGYSIFLDENKGDCFHCHGDEFNPLWTNNLFHNNGLDASFETDKGLGWTTGNALDDGKFRSPSIRNLAFTGPYMHDGRFTTLDEVIGHYSTGLVNSPTIDPLMKSVGMGGVGLTPTEIDMLKFFLLSLSDSSFITNPEFME